MRSVTLSLIASVGALALAGCAQELANVPLIGSLSLPRMPWEAEAPPPMVEPAPVQAVIPPPPEPAVRPGKRSRTAAKTRKKAACKTGYRLPNGKCAPRPA
jgi:hypothetical protein